MDRTERLYKIDQLLRSHRAVPLVTLLEELQVSPATIKRDLEYLRDRLNAPIVWDREARGYRYQEPALGAPRYALPGLWFNAAEVHALLSMEHLLANLQPGLLGPHIEPLRTRIRLLLDSGDHSADEVVNRIRILHLAARPVPPQHFEQITSGLLGRRRLRIAHHNRRLDQISQRDISPQRLIYYRDNWYLDAWCHQRQALRSFGVDAIQSVEVLGEPAWEIPDSDLDAEFASGYGIFAGQQTQTARLRFSSERARWVAREQWHPEQQGHFDAQGRYLLEFPYANDTELLMDLLRYGSDVEVLEPEELRQRVKDSLQQALGNYDAKCTLGARNHRDRKNRKNSFTASPGELLTPE